MLWLTRRHADQTMSLLIFQLSSVTDMIRTTYAGDGMCEALQRALGSKEFGDSDKKLSLRLRARLHRYCLVGSQARWPVDKPFEKIVPPPADDTEDNATSIVAEVRLDSHEQWLEKLEKTAGAGLEELQKQSIEASKKTEQAAVARRIAADRRKREEKDVSSKHLQNFFNNLLSRPEKTKSSRSLTDKK
ncbi:dynein 1 light intermediate [Plasmopara halstedii]|uniref:Dynein 1 light intermediate n=1 Tax=Plasmopara halstedii TaxID=4781 RepID=A0A0P1AFN1_PLAHL|nr:dynein 1 light intermediate [Plasmopara halstedii]CEG39549.1 dynein 1 light intermediate [Plasmopara halstedii]|eukprot:XP_024575918.1 dynein 1 light intermediate [Plasmopara halstedii]